MVTSNGVYLVIACLSWKQHATVNYVRGTACKMPRGAAIQNAEAKGGTF